MNNRLKTRLWASRFLIALVVAWNLQAALVFLISPQTYVSGFELSGASGLAAMRGFAVLFIMWNIPYIIALWHPHRHLVSLWEALAMQVVGVVGESIILLTLPGGHELLHSSLLRFIAFDFSGVVLLGIAAYLVTR